MIRIFKLVLLLVCSQVVFGQAPSNYTNINGRYRWIAGMFDSTFHIPKGSTPSLRTGGSTNAGGLFYNTSDSSVYTYTGTQWIKLRGLVIDTTSLSNRINLKLNISDTAAMLSPYARTNAVNAGLATKVNISDTASMLSPYARKNFLNAGTGISYSSTTGTIANTAPDQTVALNAGTGISISGTYPNFTITNSSPSSGGTVTSVGSNNGTGLTGGPITTSGTLAIDTLLISTRAWRQKGIDSVQANLTAGLALKLNISDTSSMLSPYLRKVDTASLSNRINTKLNISDTSSMLTNYLNNVGYGLLRTGQVARADSATLANYFLRRKDSLTSSNLLGYVTRKVLADTAAAIRSADAGGTVTSVATNNGTGITGGTITTAGTLAIDTALISTRAWRQKGVDSLQANINLKLNISDTASMLSPYLRSNTAAATYVPQTRTITINGTSQDLSANRTFNVGTVTSVGITAGTGISVANSPVTGSGNITVTNTAPDQTVSLSAGSGISISGTYPSFTITNSSPSSGGTVTSVGSGTGLTGGPITTSGTLAVDTLLISTRLWRQKGVDSVAALANTKVSSVAGTAPISSSGGTSPTISISQASGSTNGFLSSTDWTTFNNKQNALTNPVTGTGTTNYIPKFTSSSAIGNSIASESGNVFIVSTSGESRLNIRSGGGNGIALTFTESGIADRYLIGSPASSGDLVFRSGAYDFSSGSERMRLDASGNLGLGTSSPSSYSNLTTLTINGTNGSVIDLKTGNTLYGELYSLANEFRIDAVGASSVLKFLTNSVTRMTLDASGNLGLGVTPSAWESPYKVFQFGSVSSIYDGGSANTGVANNVFVNTSGSSRYLTTNYASLYDQYLGQHRWFNAPSGTAGNAISFTQAMTLDASGRLGIGTTSPATSLEVAGSVRAYLNSATSTELFAENNTVKVRLIAGTSSSFLSTTTNHPLIFETNNAERMRITSGGELLINTTSDAGDFKLQVNGNALFSGTIKTDAPAGYTAREWKLGEKVDAGVTFDGNKYIAIDIGGTVYYLALVTIN